MSEKKYTDIERLIDLLDNANFNGKVEALALAQKIQNKSDRKSEKK